MTKARGAYAQGVAQGVYALHDTAFRRISPMTRERLYLYDTTLRDGQQTQGVQFSTGEKLKISSALDELGLDYIEGGWPGANPTDTAFFDARPETSRDPDRLRHDQTRRPLGRERRRARRGHERRHQRGLPRGQDT